MTDIEGLFIRIVGDNAPDSGQSDLHIREFEFLNGLEWKEITALKLRLIKDGYIEDVGGFMYLTKSGKELYTGETKAIKTKEVKTVERQKKFDGRVSVEQQIGRDDRKEKSEPKPINLFDMGS